MIEAVLRKAEFARTTNFDLLGEEGNALLAEEVSKDFPYLTLADLDNIITRGVKGLLDKRPNQPVNFTRIYQWVVQRAPYAEGYWRNLYPLDMEWADLADVAWTIMQDMDAYQTPAEAFPNERAFRRLIRVALREKFGLDPHYDTRLLRHEHAQYLATKPEYMDFMEAVGKPFAAEHPELNEDHNPLY